MARKVVGLDIGTTAVRAAENNIVIVADTTYTTTGVASTDMLGWSPTSSCRSTTRSTRAGATCPTAATRPRPSPTPRSTRPYRVSQWAEIQNPSGLPS